MLAAGTPSLLEPTEFAVHAVEAGFISEPTFQLQAVDPDGDTITFSITGGDDGDLFTVDATTGELRFPGVVPGGAGLDANSDRTYLIEVTVSDGLLSSSQTIEVLLNAGNGFAPFLVEPISFYVPDAELSGSPNGFLAADLQAVDPENDPITFSIAGGADGALFTIDAVTGELFFINAPDFDTPLDADANNIYVVDIQVADAFGQNVQQVEIHLVDSVPPPPPPRPIIISPVPLTQFDPIRDFLNVGSIGTITDIELEFEAPTNPFDFFLFGEDAPLFDIDPMTGEIGLSAPLVGVTSFDGDLVFEVIALVENDLGGSDTLELEYLLFQGG